MRAFALARRHDGTDEIARLEAEVALDRLAVANRKAVLIRSAHLAIPVPGCLDTQRLQSRIERNGGALGIRARDDRDSVRNRERALRYGKVVSHLFPVAEFKAACRMSGLHNPKAKAPIEAIALKSVNCVG